MRPCGHSDYLQIYNRFLLDLEESWAMRQCDIIDHYAKIILVHSYTRLCNLITERVSEALNIPLLEGTQEQTKTINHECGLESIS